MVGFSRVEVKPLGPVHEYVALATVAEVKLSVVPEQTGPLFPTGVGAAGMGFTVAEVVPAGPAHPPTVTVTE
jgi:hypothetical protein